MEVMFAHQFAGLNRTGAFRKPSPYKAQRRTSDEPAPAAEPGAEWQRDFAQLENNSADERRAGLARLVQALKETARTRLQHRDAANREDTEKGKDWRTATLGCTVNALPEVNQWARVVNMGTPLDAFCAQYDMPRATLSRLTRMHCGLSASELVDGFRLAGLKNALLDQLRHAARRLWGAPGSLAERLMVEGALARPRSLLNATMERSKFFGANEPNWESLRGTSEERTEQLVAELQQLRRSGDMATPQRCFDLTSLAVSLGFEAASSLRRACATVYGQPISAIERVLAAEIVDYYLCAEEKVLRDAASHAEESAIVCRARYLYSGDEDYRPEPPYVDRWSSAEFFRGGWLSAMQDAFG
ncbi:MAG TPA: hypothetical protein VEK08_15250 [Planctomycetota bacterium]|nr:hypothetical protein [Planctomycetota bacterium]